MYPLPFLFRSLSVAEGIGVAGGAEGPEGLRSVFRQTSCIVTVAKPDLPHVRIATGLHDNNGNGRNVGSYTNRGCSIFTE